MAASLIQKELAVVGAVDGDVAARAFTTCCEPQPSMRNVRSLRIHMTLQAKEPALPPHHKHLIHAAVRRVAGTAPFHLYGGMLENKRAPLLAVARDASLPCGFLQHGLIAGAVRVVAIRAAHQSFRDAVMRRQR